MAHAYDARIDVSDADEPWWLRITADLADEEGEPIDAQYRTIVVEFEETGEMWLLHQVQAEQFAQHLLRAVMTARSETKRTIVLNLHEPF